MKKTKQSNNFIVTPEVVLRRMIPNMAKKIVLKAKSKVVKMAN